MGRNNTKRNARLAAEAAAMGMTLDDARTYWARQSYTLPDGCPSFIHEGHYHGKTTTGRHAAYARAVGEQWLRDAPLRRAAADARRERIRNGTPTMDDRFHMYAEALARSLRESFDDYIMNGANPRR